jgi:hypothetical protein
MMLNGFSFILLSSPEGGFCQWQAATADLLEVQKNWRCLDGAVPVGGKGPAAKR